MYIKCNEKSFDNQIGITLYSVYNMEAEKNYTPLYFIIFSPSTMCFSVSDFFFEMLSKTYLLLCYVAISFLL